MSSVLSYNVFDFTTVFAKEDKNVTDKKRNHEPTFVKQMLYCLGFISLNLGYLNTVSKSFNINLVVMTFSEH